MENTNVEPTQQKWYHYIAAFFSGVFWANVVPHYVNGVSGDPFPSPFSNPPGVGLSAPWINVLWALFNLFVGYLLYRASKLSSKTKLALFIFFIGIALMSINLSIHFVGKAKL